jgi:hypothetical protein
MSIGGKDFDIAWHMHVADHHAQALLQIAQTGFPNELTLKLLFRSVLWEPPFPPVDCRRKLTRGHKLS